MSLAFALKAAGASGSVKLLLLFPKLPLCQTAAQPHPQILPTVLHHHLLRSSTTTRNSVHHEISSGSPGTSNISFSTARGCHSAFVASGQPTYKLYTLSPQGYNDIPYSIDKHFARAINTIVRVVNFAINCISATKEHCCNTAFGEHLEGLCW